MTRHRDTYFGYRTLRLALKAARKKARIYAQQPFNFAAEDRRFYVRELSETIDGLRVVLSYRDCWQYGRHVHGAVSGTIEQNKAAIRQDLQIVLPFRRKVGFYAQA